MNRESGESRSVGATNVSRYNQNPVLTKDGTKILFLAGTEWNAGSRAIYSLWEVKADGSDVKQLADSSLFTRPAEWKPNRYEQPKTEQCRAHGGRHLVFTNGKSTRRPR